MFDYIGLCRKNPGSTYTVFAKTTDNANNDDDLTAKHDSKIYDNPKYLHGMVVCDSMHIDETWHYINIG